MTLDDIFYLQIEPTSHCNSKCPHCPRFLTTDYWGVESTVQLHPDLILSHMDIETVVKNLELDKMAALGTVRIEGDKGDPLMHPDIELLVDAFAQAPSQPVIELVTNGSIRSPEWWYDLAQKKYPRLKVFFSIDGLEDTNHLYRVGLKYDRILDNAQAFIDGGGTAIWKTLIFKHNYHQQKDMELQSKKMGFKEFHVTSSDPSRFKNIEKWPVEIKGQTHYLEYIDCEERCVRHEKINIPISKTPVPRIERLCPNLIKGHVYINYLNQVIPCCMMHFDTQLNYPGKHQLEKLTSGFDKLDLKIKKMSEVLAGEFFSTKLTESLMSNQRHDTCAKICGTSINNNIKLHLESVHD